MSRMCCAHPPISYILGVLLYVSTKISQHALNWQNLNKSKNMKHNDFLKIINSYLLFLLSIFNTVYLYCTEQIKMPRIITVGC